MFTTSWGNLNKIVWFSELYDKKPFSMLTMLTISDISLAPFWKRLLQAKQFNYAKVFITWFSSLIPKITVVWHVEPGYKLQ